MKYNIPHDVEVDQYGHVKDGRTDPYLHCNFAVGSADDFICFDYSINESYGRSLCILHAVVNSETGSFIQDFNYQVIDINDPEFKGIGDFEIKCLKVARDMIESAIDWTADNKVRHDKTGWDQDPYHFVRVLAKRLARFGDDPNHYGSLRDARAVRFGSKKVNSIVEGMGDFGKLPITRRPKRKESIAF